VERGDLQEGDVFLLCSDGLTDVVPDDGIRRLLAESEASPDQISDRLVKAANTAGGPDNITVVVVRVAPGSSADEEDTGKFRVV